MESSRVSKLAAKSLLLLYRHNPPTSVNPYPRFPNIHNQAFLIPFMYVVGDVTIQNNTYIGPFVRIRADEGTPFYNGSNSNL